MTSWVYLLSQFTPEALLFEALIFFLLFCGYTAFWVLRKRRFGSANSNLPSGPVQSYLNELIGNAEQLRLQLFGLLGDRNMTLDPTQRKFIDPSGFIDPDAAKKLSSLESKMIAQAKALESIQNEKDQLEKALADAKSAGGAQAPSQDNGAASKLREKMTELESRLAEYNVIEDDLANLKRLQQENTQLKAQLSGKYTAPSLAETPASVPATPTTPEASPDVFAGLVEPVENSLQETAPAEASPSSSALDEPDLSTPGKSESEKSEADLVAEFEKMLKG